MTILHLITRRQYRGAEVFAAQLTERMMARGHRVVLAGLYAPPDEQELRVEGAVHIDISQGNPGRIPSLQIMRGIAKIVRDYEVDLVQANASDNLKYAVLSRRFFLWETPIVFRNASIVSAWIKGRMHRRINRWLLSEVEAIACVSRLSQDDLKRNMEVSPQSLHYLPIGVDLSETSNRALGRKLLKEVADIPPEALVLIHVGAFTPEKNQEELIRLMEDLPERIKGQSLHLVSIGEGSRRPEIMAMARSSTAAARIHFLGYRKDVPQLLPAADLFVLPSKIEGTPGVVLEAAAHEVAAIGYDVGAMRECFPATLSDAVIPFGNFQLLLEKCQSLLTHPDKRRERATQARAFVEKAYDLQTVTEDFLRLYHQLTEKPIVG